MTTVTTTEGWRWSVMLWVPVHTHGTPAPSKTGGRGATDRAAKTTRTHQHEIDNSKLDYLQQFCPHWSSVVWPTRHIRRNICVVDVVSVSWVAITKEWFPSRDTVGHISGYPSFAPCVRGNCIVHFIIDRVKTGCLGRFAIGQCRFAMTFVLPRRTRPK